MEIQGEWLILLLLGLFNLCWTIGVAASLDTLHSRIDEMEKRG